MKVDLYPSPMGVHVVGVWVVTLQPESSCLADGSLETLSFDKEVPCNMYKYLLC